MDHLEFILVICLMSFPSSLEHQNLPPGVPPQQYAQGSGQPQYQQHPPQQANEYQRVAPGVDPSHYQKQQPHQYPPQQQQQQQFQAPPHQQHQQFQAPPNQQQQFQAPPQQQQQFQASPQQHQASGGHEHAHENQRVLHSENIKEEREHIKDHLDVPLDTAGMSEEELQFHYFKMHDADNNNRLDGQELLKSLFHWHDSANHHETNKDTPRPPPKIFTDDELGSMIDPIMEQDDKNWDGYIDYSEFISAQKKAAASTPNSPPPQ